MLNEILFGRGLRLFAPDPPYLLAEKRACARRGLPHYGGSGRPDCGRDVEVKHWRRPVDSGTVLREYDKGRREIVSASGFTARAWEVARDYGVRLSYR